MWLAFYSPIRCLRNGVDWNEAKKEKNITLEYTIESESLGNTGKNACYCAAWFLVGIDEGSFGKKVQGREIRHTTVCRTLCLYNDE
jgi:hypothetical protein